MKQRAFTPLPPGAVRPSGWLWNQCRIQAEGITGRLEEFWPDLGPENMWLGGKTEGWERGPYYLDGLIPLAYILDDERLQAQAQKWINSILAMQDETGWIGPVQPPNRKPYDQWPVAIVLKVLTQYYEAVEDARVLPVLRKFCGYLRDTLAERPLFEWGKFRWADLVLSIHWLYERTGETWLLEVAEQIRQQGYDWRAHFEQFPFRQKTRRENCTLETHVVNNAMGIKTSGVWWRQSGDEQDRMGVYRALEVLDEYHGQATGIFTGDEHLAGKSPSQGTELCAVVEYLFSLEELIALFGETEFADRLEKIAYNALPAAFTPDMWAHQYDQQANQVLCTIDKRQWTNNDDDSNIYGLEPNFGCCTANLHQGWPKFVKSLWMQTEGTRNAATAPIENSPAGLAAVAYGPCQVTATVGDGVEVTIVEETEYPFRETVTFTLQMERAVRFPLMLRIPGWATRAAVQIGTETAQAAEAEGFHTIAREWHPGDTVTLTLPMEVRLERRFHEALTVLRGPLVFALQIGEEFRPLAQHGPVTDYAVYPTTPWNYGLHVSVQSPGESLQVQEFPMGDPPFAPDAAPVKIAAQARRLPQWTLEENSAGPLPPSPAETDAPMETVELIPYGSANLRVTEFPQTL